MGLELGFLGDFEVRRDGQPQPLPPSKKTRALLAYLALQPRPFRREQLCELLWEIPDDPRGSLRWSLSKLRRLVDSGDRRRVVADRTSVRIDTDDLAIDVRELAGIVGADLADTPTETLTAAAARFRGNFLEGLEFPDFHDFHAWCVAEREQALRNRAALLGELVRRLAGEPERALGHARALVGLFPYDETLRAQLIRLLHAAGLATEAGEQYQLGLRMLKEAGITPAGALAAARRAPRIDAPPETGSRPPESVPPAAVAARRALIGRERETLELEAALAEVIETGRAAMRLVRGVPGIGKTRLLESLLEPATGAGAFVLQATAFESEAIRPFAMWIDALRAQDDGDLDAVFGDHEADNRDRLLAGLSGLVARESAGRPVVLLFDDVQWCDESSAAALHYVMRMNRDRPVLGVVAAREGELRDNVAVEQALRGLKRDGLLQDTELGALPDDALAELIAGEAPGADTARLSRECGGNPLLAIELARAQDRGSIGGSLNDLVRERLARFGVAGSEVLRWAAVLGSRIDIDTLVRLLGRDADGVGAALEDAERHGMLQATGRGLRFAHELIASAVYADISPLRRRVMHRRVAELLEADAAVDLARAADLAHHATQSGDPALAARAMVSAGRLCLRFFAYDDAQSLARKGLQLAESLPDGERVQLEIDLNDVLLVAGAVEDWDAAAERFAALAEQALDHGALAHARLGYHMASSVRWAQGRWTDAREQSLQAARVVRGGEDEAHIIGTAETAKCLAMIERDLSRADAMLMEAAALAERKRFSHQAIAAGRGMLSFHQGRLDEAEELFQEARTLCKSAGDRVNEFQANEYLAMLDLHRGRIEAARARCAELLALGRKLRGGSEEAFARALCGLCAYALDDEAQALETALEELRIVDAKHRLAFVLTRAALIDCERGRTEQAVARAGEALGYAKLLERATETVIASAVLARGRRAAGDEAEAERLAAESAGLGTQAAAWAGDIAARLLDAGMPPLAETAP